MLTYYYDATGICGFRYKDLILGAYTDYQYRKNLQGDIIGIYGSGRTEEVTYRYDAWGNLLSAEGNTLLIDVNPFTYRGYYRDAETGWYYLNTRYYDPSVCRFINADDSAYLEPETLCGMNLYSYCLNNPVMYVDPMGYMPDWLKWVIGGIVIIGLGIAVLATGGAAAGVAGFILAGAFKGALIGAVSGALISGTIGGISTAIAGEGFWSGFAGGAADGFMFGAITGAISGAVTNGIRVAQAAKMWQPGTSVRTATSYKTMVHHYKSHGQGFGNIVNYTKQASNFAVRNANSLSFVARNPALTPHWTLVASKGGTIVGMNGHFTSAGKILTFWM